MARLIKFHQIKRAEVSIRAGKLGAKIKTSFGYFIFLHPLQAVARAKGRDRFLGGEEGRRRHLHMRG
jgi:hypothetical protein